MPYANLDGVKLYYEIYGHELDLKEDHLIQRPTLLVVHGGPGLDHVFYEVPFLKEAAEFAQVIFIDQRGHGRSIDNNPAHWNLTQWATDIAQFCDTLGLEHPFVYGASFGGWVVQKYATLFPNRAQGIILVDTESHIDLEGILNHFEKIGGKNVRDIAERFFKTSEPTARAAYFQHCFPLCTYHPIPQGWFKRAIFTPECGDYFKEHEFFSINLLANLKDIQVPVLYLMSADSPRHLLESAKQTATAFDPQYLYFKIFDHCRAVPIDKKAEGLACIREFLLTHQGATCHTR